MVFLLAINFFYGSSKSEPVEQDNLEASETIAKKNHQYIFHSQKSSMALKISVRIADPTPYLQTLR